MGNTDDVSLRRAPGCPGWPAGDVPCAMCCDVRNLFVFGTQGLAREGVTPGVGGAST